MYTTTILYYMCTKKSQISSKIFSYKRESSHVFEFFKSLIYYGILFQLLYTGKCTSLQIYISVWNNFGQYSFGYSVNTHHSSSSSGQKYGITLTASLHMCLSVCLSYHISNMQIQQPIPLIPDYSMPLPLQPQSNIPLFLS